MNKPVLVIMAAGLGSRYGGLKQMDPMDAYGNLIIDFSIYDAIRAGFEKVVFIVKEANIQDFKDTIGKRISPFIETEYVVQDMADIPEGYEIPDGRVKPWGTGHAILACAEAVNAQSINPGSKLSKANRPDLDNLTGSFPHTDWRTQISHAKKLGLGEDEYELITI